MRGSGADTGAISAPCCVQTLMLLRYFARTWVWLTRSASLAPKVAPRPSLLGSTDRGPPPPVLPRATLPTGMTPRFLCVWGN